MITRKELYKKFGPLLVEAVVLIIKDEINLLRVECGLPERTNQQMVSAIESKLGTLSEYDWMSEE